MFDPAVSQSFVGREKELAALCGALARARQGHGGLWLITGEAGIGKTRLTAELAQRGRAEGTWVLRGSCWQGEGAPPFWPWRQLLNAARHEAGAASVIVAAGAHLAPFLPSAHPHDAAAAGVMASDPAARFRLFDAVATVLRQLCRARPVVVVFDDIHAADVPSLMLLRFVARDLSGAPLLFLGTYRRSDPLPGTASGDVLTLIEREGQVLGLRGFSSAETKTFIERATGREPAAAVVDALQARTHGNPFFLGEIVRLLQAGEPGGEWGAGAIAQSPTPPSVLAIVRERIARLSLPCRRLLAVAAANGIEIDAPLATRVLAAPDEISVLAAADEAVAAAVLCRDDPPFHRFRFVHPLLREALYEALPATERARLHELLALALEERAAAEVEPNYAELAQHFLRVPGTPALSKAVEYGARAGDQARASLAYEKAAVSYALALSALERIPDAAADPEMHRRRQCTLLLALGEVQLLSADKAAARAAFSRAAACARALRAPDLLAQAALGFAGGADVSAARDNDAISLLEEALQSVGNGAPRLRAQLLGRLAATLSFSAPERAVEISREGVISAESSGDPATLASLLSARRFVLLGPDDFAERAELTARIVTLSERLDDRNLRCASEFWRLLDCLERGNGAEADAALARYAHQAGELRQPFLAWRARVLGAMRLLLTGRFAEAERAMEEALTLGQQAQTPNALLVYAVQLLELRRQQGRLRDMGALIDEIATTHAEIPAMRCGIALLRAEIGQLDAARPVLESILHDGASWLPRDGAWLGSMNALAHVTMILREKEAAPMLYEKLLPFARRCVVIGYGDLCQGAVARALGLLAGLNESWSEAAAHFETALALNRRLGAAALVAHCRHEFASVLLACGRAAEREKARALLSAAIPVFEQLGLATHAAGAAALRDGAANGSPSRPAGEAGANVFRRDHELWLMAYEGKTVRLRNRRGFLYIAQLLREPGREFHVADLVGLGTPGGRLPRLPDGVAVPDARAKAAYRARLAELEEDAAEADRFNDPARAGGARAEAARLRAELANRYGLGHYSRSPGFERVRKAVAKCVREAIARIESAHPALGRHLRLTIKTGVFCSYNTDRPIVWQAD
jgi:hypothetical protein